MAIKKDNVKTLKELGYTATTGFLIGIGTFDKLVSKAPTSADSMLLIGGIPFFNGSTINAQLESERTKRYSNFCCIAFFICNY